MKNPNEAAFPGGLITEGLTRKEYVFIEVLKALIKPGCVYDSMVMRNDLIISATLITEKVFEK